MSRGPGVYGRHSGTHRDILVARRTAKTPLTTISVPVETRDALNAYLERLAEEEGEDPSQAQLIAALVHGTTLGLAAHMVRQYVRHRAALGEKGDEADDDPAADAGGSSMSLP